MRKQTAFVGISISLAIIFSYIELLIPFHIGIPGVKIGLANIVIIVVLYLANNKTAIIVSIFRVVLVGFLFSNMYSILYSLAGGIASLCVMILCKKSKKFTIVGVSVIGGVVHNIAQIVVATFIVDNTRILSYLPILLVTGTITGAAIGLVASSVTARIRRSIKFNLKELKRDG